MRQPKAKWSPYDEDTRRIWTAAVGPFYLDVNANAGTCEIAEWEADSGTIGETLWEQDVPTPCDVVDLMLLAEADLERRLRGAAETMRGEELVATPAPAETMQCRFCSSVVGTAETFEDVCASCLRESHAMRNAAIAVKHTPGADCSACEACGTHCLPIGSVVDGRCRCCGPARQPLVERIETQWGPVFIRSSTAVPRGTALFIGANAIAGKIVSIGCLDIKPPPCVECGTPAKVEAGNGYISIRHECPCRPAAGVAQISRVGD